MTFRALYRLERRELLPCPVLGVASDDITLEELVKRAHKAIADTGEKMDDKVFDRLADRLSYLHGDVTDHALYDSLAERIGSKRCLYYLEMPPSLFASIVERLAKADLLQGSRVALEKPFGHDLASAQELNARLHAVLDEEQILRVDHFLGKQPIVELEYLRFGNLALAELWDRNSISEIQITMGEDFGVQDRGRTQLGRPERQEGRCVPRDARGGPGPIRARAVRGLYRHRRDLGSFTDRDLCRAAVGDRQLALGRGADLSAGREGAAGEGHRSPAVSSTHPAVGFPAQIDPGGGESDCVAHRAGPRAAPAADRSGPARLAGRAPGFQVRRGFGRTDRNL